MLRGDVDIVLDAFGMMCCWDVEEMGLGICDVGLHEA